MDSQLLLLLLLNRRLERHCFDQQTKGGIGVMQPQRSCSATICLLAFPCITGWVTPACT
jgi:hypothetical protein